MRLLRLKLKGKYRSLNNFDQTFRTAEGPAKSIEPICFVGLNGTGKSNVVEALSEIFCYLELICLPYKSVRKKAKTTNLSFEIAYELPADGKKGYRHILISKLDSKEPAFFEVIEGDRHKIESPEDKLAALPSRIIGYSSGLNEVISVSFLRNQSYYSQEVRERAIYSTYLEPVLNTRTLYMDYESNAAIVLANYMFRTKRELALFKRLLRIEDVSSFRLTVQFKPRGRSDHVKRTPELDDYVERLKKCSQFCERNESLDGWTFDYRVNKETRGAFRHYFQSANKLFVALYKLSLLNALALTREEREYYRRASTKEDLREKPPEVSAKEKIFRIDKLKLRISQPRREIDYLGISDGEHQLLHVVGTVMMFDEPGCLFLLDEPETHLNPEWRVLFGQILNEIAANRKQEFLISSHSPFILSDCHGRNVFHFRRKGQYINCGKSEIETYGASFDYLLTRFFDLPALISEKAIREMEEVIKAGDLAQLQDAVSQFGESFEKRYLYEKIAELKAKSKR
ncbi:MAG: restriction system-associated AAA family ATPase [Candidatus Hodarchaeota archaeon]